MVIFLTLVFISFIIFIIAIQTQKNSQSDETIKTAKGDDMAVWPFEPMPIMTPTEVIFFNKLQRAIPEYLIFGQVQLSRIIMPADDGETDQSFWFNRICRMSVDYVIVDNDRQTVLVAIELDDWTHNSRRRQQQDDKKDKALSSAGIPVIRFHSEAMPDIIQLRHQLFQVIDI